MCHCQWRGYFCTDSVHPAFVTPPISLFKKEKRAASGPKRKYWVAALARRPKTAVSWRPRITAAEKFSFLPNALWFAVEELRSRMAHCAGKAGCLSDLTSFSFRAPRCAQRCPGEIPQAPPIPFGAGNPLRSRQRLCRFTDAAYPLRVKGRGRCPGD